MIVNYDFRCGTCWVTFDNLVEDGTRETPCVMCPGTAKQIWITSPGILNKAKGIYPYRDPQLGVVFESPQHRDRIIKERGLITLGKEELTRTVNNWHEPDEPQIDKAALHDAIEKAQADIASQNIPIEGAPTIDEAISEMEGETVTDQKVITEVA